MNVTFVILGVFLIFGVDTIQSFDQTKFHTSDKSNVYFIENEQKYDWFESLAKCARMNMSLLTIESRDKSNEVNRLVQTKFGRNYVLWVGGYLIGSSRQFTWVSNGEAFGYTFWHTGQPDFAGNSEYCAQIGWGPNMEWNDHVCSRKFGYICEYLRTKPEAAQPPQDLCKNYDDKGNWNQKYRNVAFNFYNRHLV